MKVIDLKKRTIYVDDIEQIYCDSFYNIQTIYGTYQVDKEDYFKVKDYLLSLNDEVEVIEEDKKIESLLNCVNGVINGEMSSYYEETDLQVIVEHNFKVIQDKINEIIDYINKE